MRARRFLITAIAALALILSSGVTAAVAVDGGSVVGTVTVPSGAVASDVLVSVQTESFSHVGSAKAGADGAFRIDGVPVGTYVVSFSYLGTAPVVSEYAGGVYKRALATRTPVVAGATATVDADLDAGAVVTVEVTDDRGPAHGSSFDISATGDTYDYQPVYRLFSTQNGAVFTSTALPPGTFRLTASGSAWFSQSRDIIVGEGTPTPSATMLPAGAPSAIVITLERKSEIAGTARVETAGGVMEPYTGYVTLIDPEDPYGGQLKYTDNGGYTFSGLDSGTYRVHFGGESALVPTTYWPGSREETPEGLITVGESDDRALSQITLRQGGMLGGKVLMDNGQGALIAAPAQVSLFKLDEDTGVYEYYAENGVDTAGEFSAYLVEDGTYAVKARPTVESGLGSEWNVDARYFADSTDIVVGQGARVQFADMVLEPRYFDIDRLAGPDRFGTAVEITRALFADAAAPDVLYLTNAYNYPDALAAGPAAIQQGGAILPVAQGYAPAVVLDEIERLEPRRIVVLGQQNAVSQNVVDQVDARLGGSVQIARIGEADRYATAAAVVRAAFPEGSRYAFIVTGRNYPDALAAGAAAGHLGAPVILVPGDGPHLPAATAKLLADLGVTDVLIAGGPTTVSPGIESDLRSLPGIATVERFAGVDRYQTAAMINQAVFAGSEFALLASGSGFADALAGSPLAGALGAPLYLTPRHCVPDDPYFQLWDQDVQGVTLLGGLPTLGVGVEELAAC